MGGRPGPGSRIGNAGAAPEPPKTPLGLLGLVLWLEGVEPPVTGLYGLGATYWVEGTETRCRRSHAPLVTGAAPRPVCPRTASVQASIASDTRTRRLMLLAS